MAQPDNNLWIRFGPALTAMQAKLAAITWDAPGGVAVPAFQAVLPFDLADLEKALRELLMFGDRCALIIHGGNHYESEVQGRLVTATAKREFRVLVTDRDVGDRMAALVGSDTTPGAELLADLVAEQLMGPLLIPGADAAGASRDRGWIEVIDATPFSIEGKVRDLLVGRTAMVVRLLLHCGDAQADLGLQHI